MKICSPLVYPALVSIAFGTGLSYGAEIGAGMLQPDEDGFDMEEGSDDPDSVLIGAAMVQGMEVAEKCGIDIFGAMALVDDSSGTGMDGMGMTSNSSSYMDALKSVVDLFPGTCNKYQAEKFESALSDFETCSSYDFERIMETVGDALFGSLVECVLAVAPVADQFIAAMEDEDDSGNDFAIPELCLESFLGQNPLGDMLRTYALYPDRVLPCFASLSESVPPCTLQKWPIPLIGPILKKTTCLLGSATPLLEELVGIDLQLVKSCLPSAISAGECDAILNLCIESGSGTFLFPKPLLGAPLSDLAKRVANEQSMDSVVAGYEDFVQKCVPTVWKGWSYANGQYDAPASGGGNDTPLLDSSISQVPSTSGSGGAGMFLGGMAFGFILSAGSVAAFVIFRKRQNQNEHQTIVTQSDSVEMI